jgi:hypothetical protein
VLKLRNFTCWLLLASMANGSVSTHSFAGTSADSWVYARMLNTVGSSMIGKNVTVDTICLSMDRISAWISASGLLDCALSRLMFNVQRSIVAVKSGVAHCPTAPWEGCPTRLISKTHRSRGILESLDIIATTSCVTAPVSNHAASHVSHGMGENDRLTANLL